MMENSSKKQEMTNRNTVEIHGCIVCGKIYEVLVVYSPDNRIVDCGVISPGGHIVPDEHQSLVACNSHSDETVETAYRKWKSRNDEGLDSKYEEN